MGRRHHFHLNIGNSTGQEKRFDSLCGEIALYVGIARSTTAEDAVTCPDCLAKITKRLLGERDAAGLPKLELRKAPPSRSYRYCYEAWQGGEHVGYIGLKGAYKSAAWVICLIKLDDDLVTYTDGFELDDDPTGERRYSRSLEFPSKERALLAIPDLVADGRLKSVPVLKAEAIAREERAVAYRIKRAQEDAEAAQLKRDTYEGLVSIRQKAEVGDDRINLSNFEIAALDNAILRYHPGNKSAEE